MKKFLVLLLTFVLAMTVLTGCGGGEDADKDKKSGGGKEASLKVGFIYIGTAKDGGYTQAQHQGTLAVQEHFGDKVECMWKESVDDQDKQAAKEAALNLIDQGCTVIIGTSFGFMDALDELANSGDYDDITFLHFSGNKMNDSNFGNYFGAMEEARYLSGMIAGKMTKSNKLGYVAAFLNTEVEIGINAFTLGAKSVNPDAQVTVVAINSWYDPTLERQAADQLLAAGCDVITQHCDTTGPLVAAEENNAYAIGYNLNNPDAAPKSYLTAPIWHHDVYLIPTIEKIINGEFKPESYYGTMADGYIDLAPMTDLVPKDVQDEVNAMKEKIVNGEFSVFSGEIKYNDGTLLCKDGQTLTREEIWQTNKLVEGANDAK